ncbi:MAG: exodeoxyribonuclease VII large subunit [Lachnospiraceae bacterium]|nr:exodeoxyribonuclease VII large subunit [Lachnospiraceae bacterium]
MKDIYSVGQINRYIKRMFDQDILLRNVSVRGEVSNCKYHSSGHIYFSLKDASGTLSCIMFAGSRRNLRFPMKNGDRVICEGTIDVYEKGGSYQLYARDIRLEGAGLLYEQFIALRDELKEMGMFANEYKKPIPKYAMKVGVVTAPEGAAIRDIQNISHRRNPYVQLYLYPARVQGEGAKASIVRGIRALDDFGVDVIIIGRGGGSLEDLWAFNEREVAEAVFACGTPVVSAVGHETDVTIADFVADLRAPTPSAAAEICVFDYEKFREKTERYAAALLGGTERRIERSRGKAEALFSSFHNITARRMIAARGNVRFYGVRLEALSPKNRINDRRRTLADAEIRMSEVMREKIRKNRERSRETREKMMNAEHRRFDGAERRQLMLIERFKGLNPLDRLRQGYSYVTDEEDRAVKSIRSVRAGSAVSIHVTDGVIRAQVREAEERKR